jgi:hypothetical protein
MPVPIVAAPMMTVMVVMPIRPVVPGVVARACSETHFIAPC